MDATQYNRRRGEDAVQEDKDDMPTAGEATTGEEQAVAGAPREITPPDGYEIVREGKTQKGDKFFARNLRDLDEAFMARLKKPESAAGLTEEGRKWRVEELNVVMNSGIAYSEYMVVKKDGFGVFRTTDRAFAEHVVSAMNEIAGLRAQLAEKEKKKDNAYEERSRVVAALAKLALANGWSAGLTETRIDGWSEDWHGCIRIDLPTGQVSWHFHDSHKPLFEGFPTYDGDWDGHDTAEKYRRLSALSVERARAEQAEARLADLTERYNHIVAASESAQRLFYNIEAVTHHFTDYADVPRDILRLIQEYKQNGGRSNA